MSNNNLFRIGGIAAIASAILYVISLGISLANPTGGVGRAMYITSSLLFLVAIFVLYMTLSGQSAVLALIALILLGGMTVWSLFLETTEISPIFGPLTLAYGVGFILFGWLQRSSPNYPSALSILAIVTGLLALAGGIALIAGASVDIFGLFNLVLSIPYLIWLVWMGLSFLKGTTNQAVTA